MKSFLSSFLASFSAIIILLLIVVVIVMVASGKEDKIEDRSWLRLEISGRVMEYDPPSDPMSILHVGGSPETLTRILGNLEKAALDDRIEGVLLEAYRGAGLATMEEIRGAIKKVRAAGKKVYGYTDNLGRANFYLLCACDEIYLAPSAYITFTGFASGSMHIKGALDKLGVKPNLHKIKDYKAAAEMLTRTDMSDAVRDNRNWILDDVWEQMLGAIQADRGLSEEQLMVMMELANFSAVRAIDGGMADEALYLDQIEERLKGEDDDELRSVSMGRYADVEPKKVGLKGKKKIAVIHAQGSIAGKKSGVNPLLGVTMGSDTVVDDLRRAREDEDIEAIVFRVNSGGGDALISDLIGHEIANCAAEKPTVVSMVNVAASGGYHIAYRATKIVADELCITGSIGSISAKFNNSELYDKLGITRDYIEKGPNALMYSSHRDFTPAEWERFSEDHQRGFDEWLADVAEKRGMTFEEAEKLAHGRIWTGRQALANGLVDAVGGYDTALALAKELAAIPADEYVQQLHYPEQKGFLSSLMSGDLVTAGEAAVNWAIYRYLHEDLAETWKLVEQQYLLEDAVPEIH